MKRFIAKNTRLIRHFIVRIVAPWFWRNTRRPQRPMIKFISEKFGDKELVGVEIGTARGGNARAILSFLNIKKLYLIDPYEPYYDGRMFIDPRFLMLGVRLWAEQTPKVILIIKKSSEAGHGVPSKVDFVYIDGNHDYKYIKKDIELYYDKVRVGGTLGGHDFNASFLGVCRAVTGFAKKKNLKLYGRQNDWWVVKQ